MADFTECVNTMKDNWESFDEILEKENTMDGKKGKREELVDDKKAHTKNLNTTDNPETSGI